MRYLVGRGDAVFEESFEPCFLLDGGLSSGARFGRYQHNDMLTICSKTTSE